jgi:hypothetical protein
VGLRPAPIKQERKVMILKKADFEQLGFKHVIELNGHPVTVICGKEMCAKTFRYDTVEDMMKEEWFMDTLAIQGPIVLYESAFDMSGKFCFRMFWHTAT